MRSYKYSVPLQFPLNYAGGVITFIGPECPLREIKNKFLVIRCCKTNQLLYTSYHARLNRDENLVITYDAQQAPRASLSHVDFPMVCFENADALAKVVQVPVQLDGTSVHVQGSVTLEYELIAFGVESVILLMHRIKTQEERMVSLESQLMDMRAALDEIMYAPGMPGFHRAQEQFSKLFEGTNVNGACVGDTEDTDVARLP